MYHYFYYLSLFVHLFSRLNYFTFCAILNLSSSGIIFLFLHDSHLVSVLLLSLIIYSSKCKLEQFGIRCKLEPFVIGCKLVSVFLSSLIIYSSRCKLDQFGIRCKLEPFVIGCKLVPFVGVQACISNFIIVNNLLIEVPA